MDDGNEYRQAGNGEHGIRAQAVRGKAGWIRRVRGIGPSFIHRQIEWPEETMELTLPPGRHETIEKQDPVHEWRVARLADLGIPWPVAEAAAGMSTGTRWRRWCSGAALRGLHCASSADTGRRLK
jgi:hypothetical protein